MKNIPIVPCIWFDDQAEAAAKLYVHTFGDARITATARYPADNPSGKPPGSVLTVELELAGQRFVGLNGGPLFVPNPSISFFVHADTIGEAERLYAALAEGGDVLMPLDAYPWSERYGWVQDRFKVSWQVIAGRRPPGAPAIVPCLMFAGRQQGRAEEAMTAYTAIFPGGRIEAVERYAGGEGPEGKVKHGRFVLAGQPVIAMDSHVDHGTTFSEAISLQLMCEDQQEIDRYWAALSEGGEEGQCGWLKDRFGLSWQVVPADIAARMTSPDAAGRERAFRALMKMRKLDIAALDRAFAGK